MTTFREKAVLMFVSSSHQNHHLSAVRAEYIGAATAFAKECCEAWGHDFQPFFPREIGAATIGFDLAASVAAFADRNRMPSHVVCARCGQRETKA